MLLLVSEGPRQVWQPGFEFINRCIFGSLYSPTHEIVWASPTHQTRTGIGYTDGPKLTTRTFVSTSWTNKSDSKAQTHEFWAAGLGWPSVLELRTKLSVSSTRRHHSSERPVCPSSRPLLRPIVSFWKNALHHFDVNFSSSSDYQKKYCARTQGKFTREVKCW